MKINKTMRKVGFRQMPITTSGAKLATHIQTPEETLKPDPEMNAMSPQNMMAARVKSHPNWIGPA